MMMKLLRWIWYQTRPEGGQTLSEYGLILAFVAIACVLALTALGAALVPWFGDFAAVLDAVPTP